MCAIAGIYSPLAELSDLDKRLQVMTDSMVHRGPDSSGYFTTHSRVALGHRRLKIVDLSDKSAQPMASNCGRYKIVFNGEIYNFEEIKKQLSYPFVSTGDTEVILAAVKERGLDWFLSQANGMFAIALYDEQEKSLLLMRDRLGVKPLFYAVSEGKIIFASEVKGILNSGLIEADFYTAAIDSYLGNRYVIEPYTFFKGIYQVPAGHFIKFNQNLGIQEIQYWKRPLPSVEVKTEKQLLEDIEVLLKDAIRLRIRSDVPVGSYLSGGVDSSLISAIAAQGIDQPLNTFTIGFTEEGFNEFSFAKEVADKYHTNHHEILVSYEKYLSEWEKQIEFKDAPLGVPNEIPLALMTQKLKKDITVVLSGEGADELFGGYGRIFRFPYEYEQGKIQGSYLDAFLKEYEYVSRDIRDSVLKKIDISLRAIQQKKVDELFIVHGHGNGLQHFFHDFHIKGLLSRLDANTMQASVEARAPFLDYRLVEYVYKFVPESLRVKWKSDAAEKNARTQTTADYSENLDTPKFLLKKIAEKYLSENIVYRKKMGFPVPLNKWLGNITEMAREELKDANWLRQDSVKELIDQADGSPRSGQILWMFINVEKFRKKYFERRWRW